MIGWFVQWFQRLVQLGVDLAISLVTGILKAPFTAASRATTAIRVRRGEPEEVVDVRHAVLRQGQRRETAIFDGDDAEGTRHWVAVQADRVVGVVTVVEAPMPSPPTLADPPPELQLRGMAVLEALQGEGIGAKLLVATQAEVAAPMWCNARVRVVAFYERHGWRPTGHPFELPRIGPHQRMWWSPDPS